MCFIKGGRCRNWQVIRWVASVVPNADVYCWSCLHGLGSIFEAQRKDGENKSKRKNKGGKV